MTGRILLAVAFGFLGGPAVAQKVACVAPVPDLEIVPAQEAAQIDNIVRLTVAHMKMRYPGGKPVLRGVHPKDHGCVTATVRVADGLPEELRVGVFATPGREYPAWVRFSNAAVLVGADSTALTHGSRGMAIKLMKVEGTRLIDKDEPLTQDFLMVNHPVFAFANVEDYEALSEALLKGGGLADKADGFFAARVKVGADGKPDLTVPMTQRAVRTAGIIKRINSLSLTATPPAYQPPPASPADTRYFSGAPYRYGGDRVMKYSAKPVAPSSAAPDVMDKDYLRAALLKRLTGPDAAAVAFDFQVQVRTKADLAGKLETEVEDACVEWGEKKYPFVTVARVTIPPQDFDTAERRQACETLFFTPWHAVADHQPLGGINRLKLAVYEASSAFRHFPKEPTGN